MKKSAKNWIAPFAAGLALGAMVFFILFMLKASAAALGVVSVAAGLGAGIWVHTALHYPPAQISVAPLLVTLVLLAGYAFFMFYEILALSEGAFALNIMVYLLAGIVLYTAMTTWIVLENSRPEPEEDQHEQDQD